MIEVFGLAPALVIADMVLKAADVDLAGAEGNAGQDTLLKFVGDAGNLRRALEVGKQAAASLNARATFALRLGFEDTSKSSLIHSPQEFSQITDGYLHMLPTAPRRVGEDAAAAAKRYREEQKNPSKKGPSMQAIGFLETQGLTAVLEGTDAMLKAASVEVIGKEKIGAAHVTIMVRGDVAAVKAAIESGKAAAEKVGKVVAAHVIARPHEGLAKLLPA
jgi:microcompartment protein CcmL/EutN